MIDIHDLTFSYPRGREVFDHLSFQVLGSRVALLGPNGAGKSTLMSIAAGLLRPSSGSVSLNGRTLGRGRKQYLSRLAFIPQSIPVVPGMRVEEQVAYVGWLKGLPAKEAKANAATAITRAGLEGLERSRVSALSGGQLRRVGIASALVHRADVIIMDEPTAGLDAVQRANFRNALADLDPAVQVLVSTHQTEDLADVYDEVVVLASGQVRFQGSQREFLATSDPSVEPARRAEMAYISLVGA